VTALTPLRDVPGGAFTMGSDHAYPEERPTREVTVAPFRLEAHQVTVAQFAAFVADTGHVTTAERVGGSTVFVMPPGPVDLSQPESWWRFTPGASWRDDPTPDHPVVHVSLADAEAYAAWAGRRLPTEAEWERAATAGGPLPPSWPLAADGRLLANVWIGTFPHEHRRPRAPGPMPVGAFDPTALGHHDLLGNVWEWTAPAVHASARVDPGDPPVIKGGSFLCAPNYCSRYRPSARQVRVDGEPACHIGLRCAADL
jgi:formylglycine-generating enzyme required for sulfatase activity